MTFVFSELTEWWIEVPKTLQNDAWRDSRSYSTPSSRWQAYLNQVCLKGLLSWFQDEYALEANVWTNSRNLPSYWEFVNGTAIEASRIRLVFVPSEASDTSELEVPQEWVDIPRWAADYYFPVQVNLDSQWIRVWGYTTHDELKTIGRYDSRDRTYCVDKHDLSRDLVAFWSTYQFCPDAQTKAETVSLPELSTVQAENLINRLGNSTVVFPRLAVSFPYWGALLESEEWRQRLYQQRQTNREENIAATTINLRQWLQNIVEDSWQSIETLFGSESSNLAFNFRSVAGSRESKTIQGKLIELNTQPEQQSVVLIVGLEEEVDERVRVRIQIHPTSGNSYIPSNLVLSLLTDSGEVLQTTQAESQDAYIQLKPFRCSQGTQFSLRIMLNDVSTTQSFMI